MPSLTTVLAQNAALQEDTPPGFVAVFVGATSGIGLATLKVLVRGLSAPRFYVIGRSEPSFAPHLTDLRHSNPHADVVFVEAAISLLKDVNAVCDNIVSRESHLDLLYMSPGSVSLGGPHNTPEGIDIIFALSYYARMHLTSRLLPLLLRGPAPRVLSVLAGGKEKALFTDGGDLGLRKPGTYTSVRAVDQVTTMHTLAFMHLATLHPKVSFLHVYPGWVATDFLEHLLHSAGTLGKAAAWVVGPVYRAIAMTKEECGERQAFHALSNRYPSREMIVTARVDAADLAACQGACSGFYRVLENGETTNDIKVLGPLEDGGWPEKVWKHSETVIDEVLGGRK
ncbi:hypothetical protein QBC36DRAFT_231731 [Triangularia setosa]|uniref:Uncharacterized protein n=1 Tax=Triangularia setosa TaxID=2587417 RepID=A0AAN7AB02_9PEZI|nr:hypothetical protein QBC36DRAFT_231731 [Podospora setosa]